MPVNASIFPTASSAHSSGVEIVMRDMIKHIISSEYFFRKYMPDSMISTFF